MRWLARRTNANWLLMISSIGFNAGFGTTFAVQTYRGYCGDGGKGGCAPSLDEQLNLTPHQAARITAARQRLLRQVEEVRRELTTERDALAELLQASEPDREAIALQVESIAALQQRIQQRVIEHLLEKKELLAPEQRETFNEIIWRRIFPCGRRGPESTPGTRESSDTPPREGAGGCRGMGRE